MLVVKADRPIDSRGLIELGASVPVRCGSWEQFERFLGLQLRSNDAVVGAICVLSDDPASFDKRETKLLRVASEKISLALDNASAFTRADRSLARRVMELSSLEDLAKQLNGTRDRDRIMELVLAKCLALTSADAGAIAADGV